MRLTEVTGRPVTAGEAAQVALAEMRANARGINEGQIRCALAPLAVAPVWGRGRASHATAREAQTWR